MLVIRNLSLSKLKNRNSFSILSNISLSIESGRITLLLGKSGSGKTSLLRCMAQLEDGYTGSIAYQDKDLRRFSPKERSQAIGFVAQNYALFPLMTVLDNCAHPLQKVLGQTKEEAYAQVDKKLGAFGMQALRHSFPYELSGGQQQRTAIIRALLLNPQFLLFDEPSSALDPENTELLIAILHELIKEGKGVVIASQDMDFAEKVLDLAFFVEGGAVVETYDQRQMALLDPHSKIHRFLG